MKFFAALLLLLTIAAPRLAAQDGKAGAFTRLGFGARAQGMGNAATAVITGTLSPLYNPAVTTFQEGHVLYGSYGFLALDRRQNQVCYTQTIRIRDKEAKVYRDEPGVQSISGVSIGWTNTGDGHIQGYDSDGMQTEELGVFENQFYANFSTRFSDRVAAGFTAKYYYTGLYRDVTTTAFGVDLGLLIRASDAVTVALVAQELLTKYKWDTGSLYGAERGNVTEDPFARIIRAGVAWQFTPDHAFAAGDIEMIDGSTFLARLGVEVPIAPTIALRAGVERLDLSGQDIAARPTAGFTIAQPVAQLRPMIHYAFILEPVAPTSTHVLSFALEF
jgi:hypothetical protein